MSTTRSTLLRARAISEPARPERSAPSTHSRIAFAAVLSAGVIYLFGSLIDVLTLWEFQRQDSPHWEFVAVGRTLDAFPRFALAIAFLGLGVFLRSGTSRWPFHLLAGFVIVTGLGSLALGLLAGMEYFTLLSTGINRQALPVFQGAVVKMGTLSVLYSMVLMGAGISMVRASRGS